MECRVFYSWQSDLPNASNRGFIEKALENVAKSIRNDESVQIEPVIDRDTAGIPGAPDIASAILAKIDKSQVFVCDVSIINLGAERPTPNPNVLIELGYALKTLGQERIIMVMNTDFGDPEHLPFDLRMKRTIKYQMSGWSDDKATERKKLEGQIFESLRLMLQEIETQALQAIAPALSIGEQAIEAIENSRPNQVTRVREFMGWIVDEIEALKPDLSGDSGLGELLIHAIDSTESLLLEFSKLSEAIALSNRLDTARALYKGFDRLLQHYDLPSQFSGHFRFVEFDFMRFMGYELFVSLIALLVREECWDLIADLLDESIYIQNGPPGRRPGIVYFDYINQETSILDSDNQILQSGRTLKRSHIINERHTKGLLSDLVPMQQFIDADFFLFLRTKLQTNGVNDLLSWEPRTAIYMRDQTPHYIVKAKRTKYAQQLLKPLAIESVETMRSQLINLVASSKNSYPRHLAYRVIRDFDLQSIGAQ
jgi:hypothetical protein